MTEHRRGWNPIKHGWVRRVADCLFPVSMRSGGEESIRRIGVARTSGVLRQGSNASDAVPFVHHILRVLPRLSVDASYAVGTRSAVTIGGWIGGLSPTYEDSYCGEWRHPKGTGVAEGRKPDRYASTELARKRNANAHAARVLSWNGSHGTSAAMGVFSLR